MQTRTVIVVVLALILGLSAAIGVHHLASRPNLVAPSDQVDVLVATGDIEPGTKLSGEMVRVRKYDKDKVPPHALTSVEQIADRAAMMQIFKDEPLVSVRLTEAGKPIFPSLIKPGWRAYSVAVVDDARLGSFLTPRCRVDILLTLRGRQGESNEGPVTTTLLQNVEVLAVGNTISPAKNDDGNQKQQRGTRNVTFMVELEQAGRLQLGSNMGSLHLVLRPTGETSFVDVKPIYAKDIIASEYSDSDLLDHPNSPSTREMAELKAQFAELQRQFAEGNPKPVAEGDAEIRQIRLIRGDTVDTATVIREKQPPTPAGVEVFRP